MKIIHLSDLHIGRWKNYEKTEILFKKIKSKYNSETNKPIIVITGDIIDDGHKFQFLEARFLLDYLSGYEVLLCPGNHDMGRNGVNVNPDNIKKYKKFLNQSIDFPIIKKVGNCYFISLNSLKGELEKEDNMRADGYCGKEQLDKLNDQIETIKNNNPDDKIIVCLHHHPFIYSNYLKLKDADKLLKVVKGKINILLFGHKHNEKRFKDKEQKYKIDLILASKKTTDIEKGILSDLKNNPVFQFCEIETDSYKITPIEILV